MESSIAAERKMRSRGWRLCWAGWIAFGVSLTLPSVHVWGWLSGWACFRIVFEGVWESLKGGHGIGPYHSGFAVANAIMLSGPLAVCLTCRDLRRLRRFGVLMALAALYTASFAMFNDVGFRHLGVGFYAWVVSFCLVASGVLHLSLERPRLESVPSRVRGIRSAEELIAIRELDEYLSREEPVFEKGETAKGTS